MKKLITSLLILAMTLTPLTTLAASAKLQTVDQAIEEMEANSNQYPMMDLKVQMAKDQLEETEDQAHGINLDRIDKYGTQNSKADARYGKYVLPAKAQFDLEMAENGKLALEEKMKLNLKEIYYKLVELSQTAKQVEISYQNLLEQRDITQTRFELGSATQLDLDKMNAKVLDLNNQLTYLKSVHETTKMKYNNLLGREDLTQNILLDETIKVNTFDYNLVKVTKDTLENQQAIKNAKRELELKFEEKDIFFRKAYTDYIKRKLSISNYKIAEMEFENAQKQLKIDIADKYFAIKKLQRELTVVDENKKNAEKDLEIAKIKLESGMITQLQYSDTENKLLQTKIEQIKKIQEHNLKIEQFDYFIKMGL